MSRLFRALSVSGANVLRVAVHLNVPNFNLIFANDSWKWSRKLRDRCLSTRRFQVARKRLQLSQRCSSYPGGPTSESQGYSLDYRPAQNIVWNPTSMCDSQN